MVLAQDGASGLWRNPWLIAPLLVAALSSCTSPPRSSSGSSSNPPHGWVRHEYGSLSVAVPASWRVISTPPDNCFPPPNDTLTEVTISKVTASACPAERVNGRQVRAVVPECLVGRASGFYAGAPRTKVVAGRTLELTDGGVYLQDEHAEGVVDLADPFGPTMLGQHRSSTFAVRPICRAGRGEITGSGHRRWDTRTMLPAARRMLGDDPR